MKAIGIDIGATNTKVALVNTVTGETGAIETFPTGAGASELIAQIRDAAQRCRGDAAIRGAGVAVAGFLNPARDRLSYNPNLEWLCGFPLKEALSSALDMSVTLEVDSNAACLAEYRFGVGRGSRRFLCLASGTGLGGGMIIDGVLLRFMGECIGDVGHVVVDRDGPECSCGGGMRGSDCGRAGNRDAGAMRRDAARCNRERGDRQCSGNRSARLRRRAIGIAAASLTQIFFPDRIALAGGFAEADDLVLAPAIAEFRRTVNGAAREHVMMMKASRGWRATLIGGALSNESQI